MGRLAGHAEPVPVRNDGDGLIAEATVEHNLKAPLLIRGGYAIDHTGTVVPATIHGSVTLWSAALLGGAGETLTLDAGPHELTIVRIGPPVSGGGGIV